jgi:5-hydroxyisourate hydrolase
MGRLTTHVLDTSSGQPAGGLKVELFGACETGTTGAPIVSASTNSDGRLDNPLMDGGTFATGRYELRFHVADYFRGNGVELPDPPFLDVVPIRFGIADASAHYHVPLLISPYGYSTYRGS